MPLSTQPTNGCWAAAACAAQFSPLPDGTKCRRPAINCRPAPTGQAVATPGFALKAKWVVHTVGPVYRSPALSAPLLYSAYQSALRQADTHGCRSIGLCSISTGIFGYPLKEAVPIALQAMRDFQGETLREIHIYCYGAEEYAAFHAALGEAEKG